MNNYSDEIKDKIKKFSSEPGRIFGLVYPYILIVIMILGTYYVLHLNDSARLKVNPPLPDSTVQKDLSVVQSRTIPPIDVNLISEPTPELIAKGKSIFNTTCTSCHGEDGKGKGPASVGLNPPPRNFTSKTGWKNGQKLSQIFTTLQEGIPGSAMAPYELLTPEEKFGLAHYIRTTFVPDPPKDAPDDLTSLDQLYNLSKGKEIPAQIPVAAAENFILKESDIRNQNFTRIMGMISNSENEEGAVIFNKVVTNKSKVIASLTVNNSWKENEQTFVNFISLNVNQNGFGGQVFNLRRDEWSKLYNYFTRIF